MIYDFEWLKKGQWFPPVRELERLKNYKDNRLLYEGKTEQVFEQYKRRFAQIISKFQDCEVMYKLDMNYFRLITLKTGDLVCGEPPTITAEQETDFGELRKDTGFDKKLHTAVCDVSKLGTSVLRVFKRADGKFDFIVLQPDMWFPIVSRENVNETLYHCIVWVEDKTPNEKNFSQKYFELNVQIHEKGGYFTRVFSIKESKGAEAVTTADGMHIVTPRYRIGDEISRGIRQFTGLDDFAIIPLHNVCSADNIYGISDYDIITPLVAELELRYSLESFILDKHSAPTMYAPEGAFMQNYNGEWSLNVGGAIRLPEGQQPPGYVTWDASFAANHEQIKNLEKKIFELSEMGAMISDESFAAAQGYDALRIRLMPALTKARRLTNNFDGQVCKLIDLLTQSHYVHVTAKDVSIYWNDGLPNDEMREVDIALKKSQLLPLKDVYIDMFEKTEEEAEEMAERKKSENISSMGGGFAFGAGGGGDEEVEESS